MTKREHDHGRSVRRLGADDAECFELRPELVDVPSHVATSGALRWDDVTGACPARERGSVDPDLSGGVGRRYEIGAGQCLFHGVSLPPRVRSSPLTPISHGLHILHTSAYRRARFAHFAHFARKVMT